MTDQPPEQKYVTTITVRHHLPIGAIVRSVHGVREARIAAIELVPLGVCYRLEYLDGGSPTRDAVAHIPLREWFRFEMVAAPSAARLAGTPDMSRPKADHPSTICPSCDGEPHPYKGCWNPDCVDGYVGAADQGADIMTDRPTVDEALLRTTTDAAVWAAEFCKVRPDVDEGLMIGWFANAIQTALDLAREQACDVYDCPGVSE